MGKLVRCIASDGSLSIMAADLTDAVEEARLIHDTSPVITAGLGRLLTAACFMGTMLKASDDSVTLRINGGGPSGSIIAVSGSSGNVRGYAANPWVDLPLNKKGKLDVSGAVGKEGSLTVMKDLGLKEPYIGSVPLVSGEIAEDVTSYFAVSEQTPTVCALGVLISTDLSVKAAGGFLVQLLPFAPESAIEAVERCINDIPPVTAMLDSGLTPEEICRKVLKEFDLEVLLESEPRYVCDCSLERVMRTLKSLSQEDLASMSEDERTEVICHFCNKRYIFTQEEIKILIS